MRTPPWTTIGLFALCIGQLILIWVHAKKEGKSFRTAVVSYALTAAAVSIILVREFFGDLPVLIEAPLAIASLLLISTVLLLGLVRLKRYVQDAWQVEEKRDK